jgi:hypothetical protein
MSNSRDTVEDQLRDAAHDAFMAFWRGAQMQAAELLWRAYGAAQEQYAAHLFARASCLTTSSAPSHQPKRDAIKHRYDKIASAPVSKITLFSSSCGKL